MKHIPTTATAAEKLKRLAKALRKETGTSLAVAQATVATSNGYESWKHVTVCAERAKAEGPTLRPLPAHMAQSLKSYADANPASADSVQAFHDGLVFALDVKDAQDFKVGDDIIECDEACTLAAADLWRVFVHSEDEEPSLAATLEPDELLEAAYEDLANYRLFRYIGTARPATLDEAFAMVLRRSFFVPPYVWLNGRFTKWQLDAALRKDTHRSFFSGRRLRAKRHLAAYIAFRSAVA